MVLATSNKAMKRTIEKMIARKGKIDQGIRNCVDCGQDYLDQDNFNWSCRVHQSEYSGEMWWCCGKTDRKAPGCRTKKHAGGNDDDEGSRLIIDQHNPYRKCMCCKEMGHRTQECPRDPNLKTCFNQLAELRRVQKLKFEQKLFMFTNIMTTKMLKTCRKSSKLRFQIFKHKNKITRSAG